jgi:hypothetical protein
VNRFVLLTLLALLAAAGIRHTVRKCPYPHGLYRKMKWMQPLRTSPS